MESELPAQKEVTNDIQEFPDRSAHHRTSGHRADFVGSHIDSQVGADSAKIKTDDSATVRGSSRALRRVDDLGDDDAVGCLSTENKEVSQVPVQTIADCPNLIHWRQSGKMPPLPRSFSPVPHLRQDRQVVAADWSVQSQTVTGWQIQWSTVCTVCGKRYRPVVGFLTAPATIRLMEVSEDEAKSIVAAVIRTRFHAGRVKNRHPDCAG